ncbi:hypothetical protein OC834_003362 [Tilletia horrida]|nr:hypothetical protein OC834_003362 [Tilletia horrida]KAK0531024.1 hypothetical protein OC835_003823 [Tilletia horrida]KAK0565714.1 hypothetical protein OC844_001082 [Tilletia horrida]
MAEGDGHQITITVSAPAAEEFASGSKPNHAQGQGAQGVQCPQEEYEYDVLYENQRGVLWFGVPKFSPSTLLQWDPSPWTDIDHANSPYNIVTAQLPDDSWEWVYPEWVIDMTADTDEAGWQYAGSFGQRRFLVLLAAPFRRALLLSGRGKTQAKADEERRRRRAERLQRRTENARRKEETRADEGIEALKRSAQARRAKWRGRPDANCFVRRRRWVRLRRKKSGEALDAAAAAPALALALGPASSPTS